MALLKEAELGRAPSISSVAVANTCQPLRTRQQPPRCLYRRIEGPGWLLQDFEAQWADANLCEAILEVVRRTEAEPSLLGASSHLMAVGRKPAGARQSSGDDGRATQ